jgi:enterochelin esterase-like enzyme
MKKRWLIPAVIAAAGIFMIRSLKTGNAAQSPEAVSVSPSPDVTSDGESHIDAISYAITYEGTEYTKTEYVYVPSSYNGDTPMKELYLMHGSSGNNKDTAETMKPLFDEWIYEGKMEPMLVIFPTYYPDHSFVVANYAQDYPLNHFFGKAEVDTAVAAVENAYRTFDDRDSRAFGGYSMGGVTTWEVLAYQADQFAWFMPMAGDAWIDQAEDFNSDEKTASFLLQGLKDNGYGSDDFHILAMVGENDGTKYSMEPQLEALREDDLINDENLQYWENAGGSHTEASFEAETEHSLTWLFQ